MNKVNEVRQGSKFRLTLNGRIYKNVYEYGYKLPRIIK